MDAQKKILLVEDEEPLRNLYLRQLIKAGFAVDTAKDGKEALEKLENRTFDLLLLDIMLPKMNGLQVLREFKTKNPQSLMITVLLTHLGQESVIKDAFKLGAQSYLLKSSYTPDQIVAEVKKILFGAESLNISKPK